MQFLQGNFLWITACDVVDGSRNKRFSRWTQPVIGEQTCEGLALPAQADPPATSILAGPLASAQVLSGTAETTTHIICCDNSDNTSWWQQARGMWAKHARPTLIKPISLEYSRKHCRQMFRPYFRIRPHWLEHTRLQGTGYPSSAPAA